MAELTGTAYNVRYNAGYGLWGTAVYVQCRRFLSLAAWVCSPPTAQGHFVVAVAARWHTGRSHARRTRRAAAQSMQMAAAEQLYTLAAVLQ